MRNNAQLMQEIVNRLYTCHLEAEDPKLQATKDRRMGAATLGAGGIAARYRPGLVWEAEAHHRLAA